MHSKQTPLWLDSLLLILFLGSLFFILLGNRPLFVPDEGRYAEIAREMITSGNYTTPFLNGIKYFEKPVLFYWLSAAAIKMGGLNLWSLRSINALLAILGCWMTYFTGRTLYDRQTGVLAAIILSTSALYFIMAHMISLDLPVSVFLAGCLYSFILSTQTTTPPKQRLYMLSSALFASCAVLTKGLIGLVFPGLIITTWYACIYFRLHENPLRYFDKKNVLYACGLFLLLTLPWHILVQIRNPEFFYFYIIEQHFLRYTHEGIGHYQPLWFFIPTLLLGFFPWCVFLPQLITQQIRAFINKRVHPVSLFFLVWFVMVFAFFSFSKSKLIPYILPVFPPLAILTAHYLRQSWSKASWLWSYIGLILLSGLLACACLLLTHYAEVPQPFIAQIYLLLASCLLLVGMVIAFYSAYQHNPNAIYYTAASAALFLVIAFSSLSYLDARSVLPLAKIIQGKLQPADEVVTFNQYYQDLPFYLAQRVSIVNWHNELSYGMKHQDTAAWMINDHEFWRRWESPRRLFVIVDKNVYRRMPGEHPGDHFYILGTTINNVLISNQNHL